MFRPFVRYSGWIVLIAASCLRPTFPAAADVPIEGNADLLQTVRAAQMTYRAKYPRGRMVAECALLDWHVPNMVMIWKDEQIYWDYESSNYPSTDRLAPEARPRPPNVGIWNAKEYINYSPKDKSVGRWPHRGDRSSLRQFLLVRPADCWFSFQDLMPWEDLIDPARTRGTMDHISVSEAGRNVAIVIHYRDTPATMRINASLELGGVITNYETVGVERGKGLSYRGTYKWRLGSDGLPRLEYMEWTRSRPDGRYSKAPWFFLRIKELDTDFVAADSRFLFASLDLPRGTRVKTISPDGKSDTTTYVGGPPTLEDLLIERAMEMRQKGFAKEDR